MAEGEPAGTELCFQIWPTNTGLKGGKQVVRIKIEHAVHATHIHRQDRGSTLERIYVTPNTCSPAKGHQVNAMFTGIAQQFNNLLPGLRISNPIWKLVNLTTS
jgi:hypothetical protein